MDKKEELIKKYSEYAKEKGFQLNPDQKAVERVVDGLFRNEEKTGQKYCPCRRLSGNQEEDAKKICPCFFHEEEIARDGKCYCGLFTK